MEMGGQTFKSSKMWPSSLSRFHHTLSRKIVRIFGVKHQLRQNFLGHNSGEKKFLPTAETWYRKKSFSSNVDPIWITERDSQLNHNKCGHYNAITQKTMPVTKDVPSLQEIAASNILSVIYRQSFRGEKDAEEKSNNGTTRSRRGGENIFGPENKVGSAAKRRTLKLSLRDLSPTR